MRTIVGISILVVVAAILAGLLWWFASTREPAQQDAEEGIYETLNLQGACSGDWDSCCESECTEFCKDHSQDYFNHYANNHLCSCWCSA